MVALMLFTSIAWSQTRTVSGKVTSADDGAATPGVNVVFKGTTNGTTTDADGKYSLTVPEGLTTLTFSFIGLATQEVEIGDRTTIDVQMANDVQQLSEIVVVGYGTQERRKIATAVSTIQGNVISKLATPSFVDQMAGRAAGVL